MKDSYYQLYWLAKDGTKAYHADPDTNTPYRYYNYSTAYEVGQRLNQPSIEHKLMFDFIDSFEFLGD